MSLYLKYRPNTLAGLRGNKEVIDTLERMLAKRDTCPHTFLLSGPTGCGKTTIGRIITALLGCSENDFQEVDSADFRGIDTVREIRRQAIYKPTSGDCRVWLIDECHKLTGDAQNAFLKILEDTPSHVYFILATTEPEKLIPAIKGRCSVFQVKPLDDDEMGVLLKKIARQEGQKLVQEVIDQIVMDSMGLPRNALQTLEQVLLVDPEQQIEVARRSAEQQSQSIELCRALLSNKGWKVVAEILNGLKGTDAETIRRVVLGYAQAVLLKGENDQAAAMLELFSEPFYNTLFPGLVYASYSVVMGR